MVPDAGADTPRYRRTILLAGIVFFVAMLLLTFFSRTILTLTLPRVEVTEPTSGPLMREIRAEGTIASADRVEMYADARMRVRELRVRPGDSVRAGAVLAVMDAGELQPELLLAVAAYERDGGSMDDLLSSIAASRVRTLEGAIEVARQKVESLAARRDSLEALRKLGSESADAVNRAGLDLAQATQDLTERQDACDRRKGEIFVTLRRSVFLAPEDALISAVNASRDSWVDTAQPLVAMLPRAAGLVALLSIPTQKAELLAVGESMEVRSGTRVAEGRIQRISESPTLGGGTREISITIDRGSDLRAGDAILVAIRKQTRPYPLLVPNDAVGHDSQGSFVYVLQSRDGALGPEHHVVKASIVVDDSDDFMTAVSGGLEPAEKVMIRSSKPVYGSGSRVVLE